MSHRMRFCYPEHQFLISVSRRLPERFKPTPYVACKVILTYALLFLPRYGVNMGSWDWDDPRAKQLAISRQKAETPIYPRPGYEPSEEACLDLTRRGILFLNAFQ